MSDPSGSTAPIAKWDPSDLDRLDEIALHLSQTGNVAMGNDIISVAVRLAELRDERDAAQEGVTAWRHVCEGLEAHLKDRVAMHDEADPERYLRILQSSIAGVRRDTEQFCNARWADSGRYREIAERLEARALAAEAALSAIGDLLRPTLTPKET